MRSHLWTRANFGAIPTRKHFLSPCHSREASEFFLTPMAQFSSQLHTLTCIQIRRTSVKHPFPLSEGYSDKHGQLSFYPTPVKSSRQEGKPELSP